MKSILTNRYLTVAAIVVATVVIFVYAYFDPIGGGYAPRCLIKVVTGYDCPGCGFQRALQAAVHGHFAEAWNYNAYLFFSLPLAALYLVAETWPGRMIRLRKILLSPIFLLFLVVSMIAWWILRNFV